LDFLASEFDDRAQNALMHLKEQAQFVRILGSYPSGSKLIGSVKKELDVLAKGHSTLRRKYMTYNIVDYLLISPSRSSSDY